MSTPLNVLIVLTSHASLGDTGERTGLWLEEFTTPYYVFADAGARITVASVKGGAVPIDARSLAPAGENPQSVKRYLADESLQTELQTSTAVDDVASGTYDVVFLPGGHGTMWDLPTSKGVSHLVSTTLAREAVVGAVCHGPAGLVNARDADGRPVVAGRRVAAFTDSEEQAAGLTDVVPFLLETRLRELGAEFEKGPDFEPFAVTDGTLVTGQNPASSSKVAELVLTTARGR